MPPAERTSRLNQRSVTAPAVTAPRRPAPNNGANNSESARAPQHSSPRGTGHSSERPEPGGPSGMAPPRRFGPGPAPPCPRPGLPPPPDAPSPPRPVPAPRRALTPSVAAALPGPAVRSGVVRRKGARRCAERAEAPRRGPPYPALPASLTRGSWHCPARPRRPAARASSAAPGGSEGRRGGGAARHRQSGPRGGPGLPEPPQRRPEGRGGARGRRERGEAGRASTGRAAARTGSRRGVGGNRPQPGRAAHCRSFGPKGVSDTRDASPKREAAQSRAADDQHRDRGMNSSGAHLQNVGEERAPRPAQRGCRPRRHTSPPAGSGPARRRFCGRPNLARVFLSAVGVGSFLAL